MRVAILLNARFPTEKAYGIQVLAMARGFAEIGIDVAVVYPRRTKVEPDYIKGVKFIPFGPLMTLRWSWLFSFYRIFGVIQARHALKKWDNKAVVLANDPLQAAELAKEFKVVWDLHDFPSNNWLFQKFFLPDIVKYCIGIISTNRLKKNTLDRFQLKLPPLMVVPNPVSFEIEECRNIKREDARKKLGIASNIFCVVYAGQLYNWKGVDTLIRSAEYLPPGVELHIVGGLGEDFERCRDLANHLKCDASTVSMHGQRPLSEIPYWLRAADLVVIPNSGKYEVSRNDTSPLKLFEAFAAGAPILASDLPSIKQGTHGSKAVEYVSNPDDPGAWAVKIQELFLRRDKLKRMKIASHIIPEWLFNPHERARLFRDFFESCLNN